MIDNIVPEHGLLRLDGAQHIAEEELKTFWSGNGVYDVETLKPLECLDVDAVNRSQTAHVQVPNQAKVKEESQPVPMIDFEHIFTIFKKNIHNCFEDFYFVD